MPLACKSFGPACPCATGAVSVKDSVRQTHKSFIIPPHRNILRDRLRPVPSIAVRQDQNVRRSGLALFSAHSSPNQFGVADVSVDDALELLGQKSVLPKVVRGIDRAGAFRVISENAKR